MNDKADKLKLPILWDDPNDMMLRHMRRRFRGFGRYDLELMKYYPVTTDYELLLHYLRGVAGPFIDFLTLIDVGCGINLVPTDFGSDEDGQEAKRVVERQFQKMELEDTMQRYDTFREVLGRAANVRTYNAAGGFYYNEQEKVTGIDAINPLSLDMKSVELVNMDRSGTVQYKQTVPGKINADNNILFDQDLVDYSTRGNILKYGIYGHSALANCLTDLRTVAAAPEFRFKLMKKQANVYMHILLDIQELLKTEMGGKLLEDWESAEKKLQESVDLFREQEKHGNSFVSWSFLRPAQVTSVSGKTTDFAATERNTYEVICMKMGIPMPLIIYPDSVRNRSTLEVMTDSFVRRREASGGRKDCRKLITRYAQEVKTAEDIIEGYFKIEFKPFLMKDLLAILERMKLLYEMGATGATEIRRSQDMPDSIDFGAEGESADYQTIPNYNPGITIENPEEQNQKVQEFKTVMKSLGYIKAL